MKSPIIRFELNKEKERVLSYTAPSAVDELTQEEKNECLSRLMELFSTAQKVISILDEENLSLRNRIFTPSSEKSHFSSLPEGQMDMYASLGLSAPEDDSVQPPTKVGEYTRAKRKARSGHDAMFANAEVKIRCIGIGAEQGAFSSYPGWEDKLRLIGHEKVRDELLYVPAQYLRLITVVEKYACDEHLDSRGVLSVLKAEAPEALIPHSCATPPLVADIAYRKFCLYQPTYRIEKDISRYGIRIPRATMGNWLVKTDEYLELIYIRMKAILLEQHYIHGDETPFSVNHTGEQEKKKSYLWAFVSGICEEHRIVIFNYEPGRNGEYATSFLEQYSGFFQADGFSGYNAICSKNKIIRLACLVHIRRKWLDALPSQKNGYISSLDQCVDTIIKIVSAELTGKYGDLVRVFFGTRDFTPPVWSDESNPEGIVIDAEAIETVSAPKMNEAQTDAGCSLDNEQGELSDGAGYGPDPDGSAAEIIHPKNDRGQSSGDGMSVSAHMPGNRCASDPNGSEPEIIHPRSLTDGSSSAESVLSKPWMITIGDTIRKPTTAEIGYAFCKKIFMIDREFNSLTPEERHRSRLEKMRPVFAAFGLWLTLQKICGGGKLATAITYSCSQFENLCNILFDGRCQLSNNAVENAIRPVTLIRKNSLFFDTAKGAKVGAHFLSVIETAKIWGLDPQKYLEYLLTVLPGSGTSDNALDAHMPWTSEVQKICRLPENGEAIDSGKISIGEFMKRHPDQVEYVQGNLCLGKHANDKQHNLGAAV